MSRRPTSSAEKADLVVGAHRFVNVQIPNKADTSIRRGKARRSRDRR